MVKPRSDSFRRKVIIFVLSSTLILSAISGFADFDLDVDKDGETKALTDGLLVLRYLFGFQGESLTQNALGEGAARTQSSEIIEYLRDNDRKTPIFN